MDLTEAEDIKKRWQEYTEELYKKDLDDPDNHDSVITHLEPDTLVLHDLQVDLPPAPTKSHRTSCGWCQWSSRGETSRLG